MPPGLRFVVFGLSITSSWGNGHATTYRALLSALARRGHDVLFLERDREWYAAHRDPQTCEGVEVAIYRSLEELRRFASRIRQADVVIVGSFVPEGRRLTDLLKRQVSGLLAFYDIDTPVTLRALEQDASDYLARRQVGAFDLYLSFTGGPTLDRLAGLGARVVRPLFCSVEPAEYRPLDMEPGWDLGYLGTYAADRQPGLERLLLAVAREWPQGRFVVGGPLYPAGIDWPPNVERREHVAPGDHRRFYAGQRFTLNLTREDMRRLGYSPSIRLFEAAACGAAILTDEWPGLEEVFVPGREVLPVRTTADVRGLLREMTGPARLAVGRRARQRVLACHTAGHRAAALEGYVWELLARVPPPATTPAAAEPVHSACSSRPAALDDGGNRA